MTVRLHFIVEGQTEEAFVKSLLIEPLASAGVFADVTLVSTKRNSPSRRHKGGVVTYERVKTDLRLRMAGDSGNDARFTTMFDVYHFPKDFPGWSACATLAKPYEHVECFEAQLLRDLGDHRLVPYFQLHEFEALLLSDPEKLLIMYPGTASAVAQLADLDQVHSSPETVNLDRPPAKRIAKLIPGYDKVTAGKQVAQAIGLDRMRQRCPHFDQWVQRLLALAA